MFEFFMTWLGLTAVLVTFYILGWIVALAERLEQRKVGQKQAMMEVKAAPSGLKRKKAA